MTAWPRTCPTCGAGYAATTCPYCPAGQAKQTDAVRETLASDLAATRRALAAAEADNDQLRAIADDLRRTLIRERAEMRAERDRRASAVRWVLH